MLKLREIRGARPGPQLLITGGVHGDEFEPMAAIRRLMREVDAKTLAGTLTLIPVVNEPAFENCSRTGPDGLDLARVCPGRANGSITERVAHALATQIRSADFYIDLHTGGTTLSVLPLAGYAIHSDPRVNETQRQMARAFNLGIVWGTGPLPGRSLSVAGDAGIPAIYAEYLGAATCTAEGVQSYVDGCLNVMAMLGMIDRNAPLSRVRYDVEDARSASGHMQIQNLAPVAGYFAPAVALGDAVSAGDLLGTVCDPLGDKVVEVRSQQTGIVLVQRTFSRINEGESVGVVLELSV